MMRKEIKLPSYGIEVCISGDGATGSIKSDLHDKGVGKDYNHAIDGLESLILAHACAGIDIESPAYLEGIETAVDAITNNLS